MPVALREKKRQDKLSGSQNIEAIQLDTGKAVQAIEEQTATTNEIARNESAAELARLASALNRVVEQFQSV